MYLPSHFIEPRLEVMHELLRTNPLCNLITSKTINGRISLQADLIPFLLFEQVGKLGTLRGHVARANPLWQDHANQEDILALFQGPDHYISPSFYPSKQEHGKVVPTWNYASVQVTGKLRIMDDRSWLLSLLAQLTGKHEANFTIPWKIADAPSEFIEQTLKNIIGIEIEIEQITGKWKVSQNRSPSDQNGVLAGLQQQPKGQDLGSFMSEYLGEHRIDGK